MIEKRPIDVGVLEWVYVGVKRHVRGMPAMSRLIGRAKENRIGRVFVDVFDWYREWDAKVVEALLTPASHLPQQERKLLRKLDLSILIFACLSCK